MISQRLITDINKWQLLSNAITKEINLLKKMTAVMTIIAEYIWLYMLYVALYNNKLNLFEDFNWISGTNFKQISFTSNIYCCYWYW